MNLLYGIGVATRNIEILPSRRRKLTPAGDVFHNTVISNHIFNEGFTQVIIALFNPDKFVKRSNPKQRLK